MVSSNESNCDRESEQKAFDESKTGVKGLVDAGVTTISPMFLQPHDPILHAPKGKYKFPIIDVGLCNGDPIMREKIVGEIREASEKWGFFEVINHGIRPSVLEGMLNCVKGFNEQDDELKKKWYTRDNTRKFVYNSNFDLYSSAAANWRDSFYCITAPDPPSPEELPESCRDILMGYANRVMALGDLLLELFSEGLGLKPNHLKDMDCAKGLAVLCHYYPACPQPELTLGTSKHADNDFFTVLLQDHIGGLQVLHQNQWVEVPPMPGALIVNIGDLLQLISNDKFISVEHRVEANHVGPRVSVACFFSTSFQPNLRLYGPIEELLSKDNPPKYRETTVVDYVVYTSGKGLGRTSSLAHYML